ncbi:MAG: hypothetical protein JWO98_4947 [Frankiales bacterium]|nr:hypothetical protein [Frankiales bacterium]
MQDRTARQGSNHPVPPPRAVEPLRAPAADSTQMNEYLRRAKAATPAALATPDVFAAANATVTGADRLAMSLEEFARAAAQLPGDAVTSVMVTVGGHAVALELSDDATDGLARWIHHAAGAAENQALIHQLAAEHLSTEAHTSRPALRLVAGSGAVR